MASRRMPPRARTTPIETVHSLLSAQEADRATRLRPPNRGPFLQNYAELPAWQQDNQYILTHYRPASYSFKGCAASLFYLHNESVNVHSHLLGAFLFFFISISLFVFERYTVEMGDIIAFAFFFAGAIACLGLSAGYHLISNHSPSVNRLANQLDYVGIVALITGSMLSSIYYGFYCEPTLRRIYWAMILSIASGCIVVSVNPKFRTPLWRPFRAGMFVGFGLSAVFPVLHGLQMYGIRRMQYSIGLYWLFSEGFLYIFGAGLYAARIPERLRPGKFDVWGSSHQIFHVLILFAATSHLLGLLTAFHHAPSFSRCA